MNTRLWKTCGYVCAKALDNLWVNSLLLAGRRGYAQVMQELSTACSHVLMGMQSLKGKGLLALLPLSTENTTTTLYLSKLIYREEEML